jgi:hypothetical protein
VQCFHAQILQIEGEAFGSRHVCLQELAAAATAHDAAAAYAARRGHFGHRVASDERLQRDLYGRAGDLEYLSVQIGQT